ARRPRVGCESAGAGGGRSRPPRRSSMPPTRRTDPATQAPRLPPTSAAARFISAPLVALELGPRRGQRVQAARRLGLAPLLLLVGLVVAARALDLRALGSEADAPPLGIDAHHLHAHLLALGVGAGGD